MKKIISLLLILALVVPVIALEPDNTPSIICLDRKYTFLDCDNYITIAGGGHHAALIRDDNSLWTFGLNNYGQLGIGSNRSAYNAPVKVLEDVKTVKVREKTTVAVKNDGSVWAFGLFADAVPKKILSGVLDADLFGITAYVDKSGTAHYINYDNEEYTLCSGAKEIYVLDNSSGDGLSAAPSSPTGFVSLGSSASSILTKNSFFIAVLKSNGDLYEYGIDRAGNAGEGSLVKRGVKSLETYGARATIYLNDGSIFSGSTLSGLTKLPANYVKYDCGYYQTADGSVYREYNNECTGKNVKTWTSVAGGTGVFMVHNDNTVSVYSMSKSEDFEARLRAINFGPGMMGKHNVYTGIEDVYSKVREICGSETDKYTNAKKLSQWIGRNIEYQYGDRDQWGVDAFRNGTGVCAAYADLTQIMLTYIDVPCFIAHSDTHAWNIAIIDGVTTFIDNTDNDYNFDMGLFEQSITDSSRKTCLFHSDYEITRYDAWAANEIRGAFDWDIIDRYLGMNYCYAISRVDFCHLVRATIEKAMDKKIDAVIADMGKSGVNVPFSDSNDPDVIAMYKLGIVNGTSPTTFSPAKNITRQEAAKILYGLAVTLGETVSAPAASFPDGGKIATWAKDGVNFVANRGIMKGKSNGFDPINTISIQESILICYRYLGSVIG